MGDVQDKLGFAHAPCEICKSTQAEHGRTLAIATRRCPRCGTFQYNPMEGWLKVETPEHMVRLSGWVREQNNSGISYPEITQEVSRRIKSMQIPRLKERALEALSVIVRQWPSLVLWVNAGDMASSLELQGRSYSRDPDEAMTLLRILVSLDFLNLHQDIFVHLSVAGLMEVESRSLKLSNSPQGFVAMSFSPALQAVWVNGFDPAIRNAGYKPFRIDAKDFVGGISDEIILEIRRSKFVVADYTEHRHGVYFEAGFALGLGLTIIPTCHANDVNGLHFDIRHLNTLVWTRPEDVADKLSKRIAAVIGKLM